MVVGALPTGSVTSCNRQPSESDVVHDHIRLRQHQIVAIACIGVRIGARHVKHTGTTEGGETVGGSSCGSELSPGGGSTEMISDGCTDANRKVLVKGVGENLLPTAQAWGLWRPGPPVAAPGTGNRHIDLLCHLIPGQALVTKLQDLLCGGGMSGRTAATHGDAGPTKLLADRGPRKRPARHRSGAGSSPGRTSRLHAQRPPRHRNESQCGIWLVRVAEESR